MRPYQQPRYVDDLLAAKTNEFRCCFISDSGQQGATVLYRGDCWLAVKHFAGNEVVAADKIALVRLNEEADPEKLTAAALATDFEGEPIWLVDVRALDGLADYGKALQVLWRSDVTKFR
jgi:hypothetical protein